LACQKAERVEFDVSMGRHLKSGGIIRQLIRGGSVLEDEVWYAWYDVFAREVIL